MQRDRDDPSIGRQSYSVVNPNLFSVTVGNTTVPSFSAPTKVYITADEATELRQAGWTITANTDDSVNARLNIASDVSSPIAVGGDYGWARYSDVSDVPITLKANERTALNFNPTDSQTLNHLKGPFYNFAFFADGKLRARAMNDLLYLQLNLLVTPQILNGILQADIDVGSNLGPTGTDSKQLLSVPGTAGRITLRFQITALSNFIQNSALFYLTSTVPALVNSETILVVPSSVSNA